MPVLHLGVVEIPYVDAPDEKSAPRARKPGLRKKAPKPVRVAIGTETTGDVATWLEDKYHVMQHFFELHGDDIAKALENSLAGSLETLLMGGAAGEASFATAESEIEILFQNFINSKELDSLGYPGIPTKASIVGIRRRFKSRRDPGRPSFQDTGTYENAFKMWLEQS